MSGCHKEAVSNEVEQFRCPSGDYIWSEEYNKCLRMLFCTTDRDYEIEFVEELHPEICYATTRNPSFKLSDEWAFIKSYNLRDTDYAKVFAERGTYCISMEDYRFGELFCLKDQPTCLKVEGNICNIFNISQEAFEAYKGDFKK
jgi:hypothetical protein